MNALVKHDWPRIIADLEAIGKTPYKISLMLGIRVNQLDLIKGGSEPKYSIGVTLLALHDELVPHETTKTCSQ